MKTLLVYYSRTGVTRMIADTISESVKCDIEEIVDTKKDQEYLDILNQVIKLLGDI